MTSAATSLSMFPPLPLNQGSSPWTAASAAAELAARRGSADRAFSGSQALLSVGAAVLLALITTTDAGRVLAGVFPAAKMAALGHSVVAGLPFEQLGSLINAALR